MRSARPLLALGMTALLLVQIPALAQDETEMRIVQIDATDFPTIRMTVTPPAVLQGETLAPGAITVTEDGERRPSTAELAVDRPLQVVLVVDTSGSMAGEPLRAAQDAAAVFIEQLGDTASIAVVGFSGEAYTSSEFSSDREVLLSAIEGLRASGETALYESVSHAAALFDGTLARRFVVLLSDGGDTVSDITLNEAEEALAQGAIGLYAVELETAESDRTALESLASVSRGTVVSAGDTTSLLRAYDLIAAELVSQLVITFDVQRGGSVVLAVTVEHPAVVATASTRVRLPRVPLLPSEPTAVTPEAPASDPASASPTLRPATEVVSFVGSGAGSLTSQVTFVVGIAMLFMAAVVIFSLAFSPVEGRSNPIRQARRAATTGPFRPAGGWLSTIAERVQAVADRLVRRRASSRLSGALDAAGVQLTPGEFVIITASSALLGFAVGLALFGFVGAVVLAAIATAIPRVVLTQRRDKRREKFADQLEATLQLLAGNLRAGYGLVQSINSVAAEASAPTRAEFSRIIVETRLGRDLDEALHALADRMDNQDFRWVTEAIDIQTNVGGDLARVLDAVSGTIRDRNQIRRQIKALSAEGRISAYILIGLPFFITGFVLVVSPEFLAPLVETGAGRIAVGIAVTLLLLGIVWIRRLVRLVF